MRLALLLLLVTVNCELDIKLPADILSDLVERPEGNSFSYNLAEGEEGEEEEEYEYEINYDWKIDQFQEINSTLGKCGKEIPQLDVSKMKAPHQIRLSYTGMCNNEFLINIRVKEVDLWMNDLRNCGMES